MRKILLLLIFHISYIMNSQQYVPMPLQNCFWLISDGIFCNNINNNPPNANSILTYKLYPTGNIFLGQKTYVAFSKLDVSNTYNSSCAYSTQVGNGYNCAIRQDTLNKMVYVRFPNDTLEKTLYNFNYVKGDSVKTVLSEVNGPNGYTARVVDSVYYHTYNDGIARKTYSLQPLAFGAMSFNNYIIEGIGNETGLTNNRRYISYGQPQIYNVNENWASLLAINNFTIAKTATNTYYNTVSLSEQVTEQSINLFPNPTNNILNINSSINFHMETTTYIISDIMGRNVLTGILKSNEIDISALPKGIFYIKFKFDNRRTSNYKIIKE